MAPITNQIQFGGLFNSLSKSQVPSGMAWRAINASVEYGVLEGRPGFGQLAKHSTFDVDDRCWGLAYCEYDGTWEYLAVIQRDGETKSRLYRFYVSGGNWTAIEVTDGAVLDSSDWSFTQFDNYVYGVNATDGLYRHQIGIVHPTTGYWEKVTTSAIVEPVGASVGTKYPPYTASRNWDAANDTPSAYSPGSDRGTSTTTFVQDSAANYTGSVQISFPTDKGAEKNFVAWLVTTTNGAGAGVDFTQSRYLYVTVETDRDTDTRANEEIRMLPRATDTVYVYISDDAAAAAGTWGDWIQCKAYVVGIEPHRSHSGYVQVGIVIDLDSTNTPNTTILNAVKKIAIGIDASTGLDWALTFSPLVKGGVFLSKERPQDDMSYDPESDYTLRDVEYAYQYYNSGTSAYGPANFLTLPVAKSYGFQLHDELIPMGAIAEITLPAGTGAYATASYDKIRLWRKRHSDTDAKRWQRIYEVANPASGTVVYDDYRVDDEDDPTTWGAAETRPDLPAPEGVDDSFSGKAIAAWKQHMVVAGGKQVFFSFANNPSAYRPSVEDGVVLSADTDDPTVGRTMFMALDRSDSCLAIVADDVLYLGGKKGIYAVVGDSAGDSTPARRLAGSNGVTGRRAMCSYLGGVLVGSQDGLFFYRANRALVGAQDTLYEHEKLTKDINASWYWLLQQEDPEFLVVREFQGEIYCICGRAFIKRTKTGKWQEGLLNSTTLTSGKLTGTPGGTGYDSSGNPLPGWPFDGGAWGATTTTDLFPGLEESDLGTDNSGTGIMPERDASQLSSEPTYGITGTIGSAAVYDLFGAPDRGWKFFSANAILFELGKTEDGIQYRNDGGRPIEWFYATGIEDGERRAREKFHAIVQTTRPASGVSSRVRMVAQSVDGAATLVTAPEQVYNTWMDVERYQNGSEYLWKVFQTQLTLLPGWRQSLSIGALDASHIVEKVWWRENIIAGGEGN